MKVVEVVAAIIKGTNEQKNKILATQRGYGQFKDLWEFPGGKIELGETKKDALIREIKEELDTIIAVGDYIHKVEYDYPDFHLTMHCYMCDILQGGLILKEHEASRWLSMEELEEVEWLPADIEILDSIRTYFNR